MESLKDMKEQSYFECIRAVSIDGMELEFVKDQFFGHTRESELGRELAYSVCHQAILENPKAIKFVKRLVPNLCLAAYYKLPESLLSVKLTPEVAKVVVTRTPHALKYIPNQTREICLAAVTRDGWALEHVNEQTPEICLAAVRSRGTALKFVKEQTPEICLAAVSANGRSLEFVKEQTAEICMRAVGEDGTALSMVKKEFMTPELEEVWLKSYW